MLSAVCRIFSFFTPISPKFSIMSEQDADEWLNRTGWRKREQKVLAAATSLIVAEAI
jgi:hypothetical protein